jgi:hypothetical protein
MSSPWSGRGGRFAVAGGLVLLGLAAVLPAHALVGALSSRFNTVAAFPQDFVAGLQTLRVALAVNGLLALAAPWLLARCALSPGTPAPLPRRTWAAAATLYAVSLALSIPFLGESFQDDEWRCLEQYVRHGPLVILTRSTEGDNHPLYSLLAWPFVALFGMGEIPVRAPSFLLSPLAAPGLFLILLRDHRPRDAWLGALPLAAAPFLLQYAAEGRAYGPLVPAILILALLHRPMLEGRRAAWFAYVSAGVAVVFLHLYGAAAVMALGTAPLIRRSGRDGALPFRSLAATAAIGTLSFLLYAPVLPQVFIYTATIDRPFAAAGEAPWSLVGNLFVPATAPFLALPFLGALAGFASTRRGPRDLGAAFLVCTALLALLVPASRSLLSHRFFTPAFALAWVPIGAGLAATLGRPIRGGALCAAVLLATGVSGWSTMRLGRRDYRAAAREVRNRMGPGESLAVRFDGRPMTPYFPPGLVVADDREIESRRPDWHVAVDSNLDVSPRFKAWLEGEYTEAFRLPSIRGALVGYRRRP